MSDNNKSRLPGGMSVAAPKAKVEATGTVKNPPPKLVNVAKDPKCGCQVATYDNKYKQLTPCIRHGLINAGQMLIQVAERIHERDGEINAAIVLMNKLREDIDELKRIHDTAD